MWHIFFYFRFRLYLFSLSLFLHIQPKAMVQLLKVVLVVAVFATAAYAQLAKDCGANIGKCPESKPCCSRMFHFSFPPILWRW